MSAEPEPTTASAAAEPAPRSLFRRIWGAGPLHLLGHLIVIGIAAYALSVMFEERFAPRPWNLLLWLVGGAVLHDAVLLPAYSAVNVVVARFARPRRERGVPILNYLRVPAVISGVLLLTFSPRIFSGQPQNFERALGYAPPDYLGRWLVVTAGLFALSAILYAARRFKAGQATPDLPAAEPGAEPSR